MTKKTEFPTNKWLITFAKDLLYTSQSLYLKWSAYAFLGKSTKVCKERQTNSKLSIGGRDSLTSSQNWGQHEIWFIKTSF